MAAPVLAPRAINLSAVLGDVCLCNLKPVAMQILGDVLGRGTQPGQITSDGQAEMEITKWNERRQKHVIVALNDLWNVGQHDILPNWMNCELVKSVASSRLA